MTRVVFVLQEPTPYRTPHLAAVAGLPDLDVEIVYAAETVQRRAWNVPRGAAHVTFLSGPSLPLTRVLHHDYALTPQIWPLLSRLRPEVLVVGGWSLMATQLSIVWARTHRVPYLLMSDNHLLEPRPRWVRAVKRLVLPLVVPGAAGWLVPGTLGREHVLHYGARSDRVIVFPLTIDVEGAGRRADELRPRRAELRRSLGFAEEDVVVLHVGRLIPHKAVDVLIRAAAEAATRVPRLRLLVVGSGPEEERLRALASELGVTASFAGHLPDERLAEAYVAADVFALLSRRETWGVVVNEAAASGLPLLLSRAVGASADLLEPGGNGEVVPPDDVPAAADALVLLASDPARRLRLAARSREIVEPWGYAPSVDALARLVRDVAP
jgi:glycosyltransferase involved in cell wall biosynthesis